MKRIERIFESLTAFCGIVAEVLVIILVLLVMGEIIGRSFFNHPIPGQIETATLTLVAIVYLAVSYTQMQEGHIRVDVFITRITGAKREFLEAFILIIALVTVLMMLWATGVRALGSVQGGEFISGIINFPVWPGRCTVVFGLLLLSLTLAVQIVRRLLTGFHLISQGKSN